MLDNQKAAIIPPFLTKNVMLNFATKLDFGQDSQKGVNMKYTSICATVIAVLLFSTANATVWYVHPDSTMNCIQHCLDSCSTGDTVLVGQGTYYENIVWPIMQGIDLISENGAAVTMINGGGTARVIEIIGTFSNATVIEGFTIQNGYHSVAGGGIYCGNGASPTIRENVIANNVVDSMGAGIECANNSSPLIQNNSIFSNISHFVGAGIGCYESSHPTIQNNVISNNLADFGSVGICCAYSSSPSIIGNTISGNTGTYWFGGIGAGGACAPTIRDNTIENNEAMWGAGIGLEGAGIIIDNDIIGNVADSMGGGIASYTNSTAVIDSNLISNNSAFKGGGIWVHENSSPQIRHNTISGNTASSGAGIRCSDYSHPYIYDNDIMDNAADSVGGGITCAYGSSPTIQGNTIRKNTVNTPGGAGIMCYITSSPYILENMIDSNTVYNGAGAGICCYSNSSPFIKQNTITYNNATRAAGIQLLNDCSPVIKHTVITFNTATVYASAIDCDTNCSPTIDSCTIANNIGSNGIHVDGGGCAPFDIHYSNIYGNSGGWVIMNEEPNTIDAEYNWWGSPSSPVGTIAGPVDFDPWLTDSVLIGIEEYEVTKPSILNLQVHPNPFRDMTTINFSVEQNAERMEVKIYDATGRLVRDLYNAMAHATGPVQISWYGDDNAGRKLPVGVYFVRLSCGDRTESQKILFVR